MRGREGRLPPLKFKSGYALAGTTVRVILITMLIVRLYL